MPSEWAVAKASELIECWNPRDSIEPLIIKALDAARAQGRIEGLEETVWIAEKVSSDCARYARKTTTASITAAGADITAERIRERIAQLKEAK